MTDTRVSDADVTAAVQAVKDRLGSIGVNTDKWKLVKVPGEGFLIIGNDGAVFPAETGNRQETIALANIWSGAFDALSAVMAVKSVNKALESAPETVPAQASTPVKAGAKKATQAV